jgi:hypothetical protein
MFLRDKILEEITQYLKNGNYDNEVCVYVKLLFNQLDLHYASHIMKEPGIMNYNAFLQKCVEALKKTKKINLIKDINEYSYFCRKIIPNDNSLEGIGYNKDEHGLYYICKDHAQSICSVVGHAIKQKKEISILCDEIIKNIQSSIEKAIFHEIMHIRQDGFEMPIGVINSDTFVKCLEEGNAMRETIYLHEPIFGSCSVPFILSEDKSEFTANYRNEYSVYQYLYFKLEILLGQHFMDIWATTAGDTTFLFKAYKAIDAKYGVGTFIKLYSDIQLILLSISDQSITDLLNDLREYKKSIALYMDKDASSLNTLCAEYKRIDSILRDPALFGIDYAIYKDSVRLTERYRFANSKRSHSASKIILAEPDQYRESLIEQVKGLKREIDIKRNFDIFKAICKANIGIYKRVIDNPSYLLK